MKKLILALLFATPAYAADLTFMWAYDEAAQIQPTGFKLYAGPDIDSLVAIQTVDGAALRSAAATVEITDKTCFGVSAFNAVGESAVTFLDDDGNPVCLGKPASPTSVSISLKIGR